MRHIAHRESTSCLNLFYIYLLREKNDPSFVNGNFFFFICRKKLDSHFSKNFKNGHCIFTTLLSSPRKTAVIFFLNKVKFPLPRMFVPSLVKVDMVIMENILNCCQCIFPIALLFPLGFICTLIPLTQDMCG